jgi:hypothetical protein
VGESSRLRKALLAAEGGEERSELLLRSLFSRSVATETLQAFEFANHPSHTLKPMDIPLAPCLTLGFSSDRDFWAATRARQAMKTVTSPRRI